MEGGRLSDPPFSPAVAPPLLAGDINSGGLVQTRDFVKGPVCGRTWLGR